MVTVDEKFPSISFNNKKIFPADLTLTPKITSYIKKKYGIPNEKEAVTQFKRRIIKGEYLGDCTVIRYNQLGHLILVDSNFYAVLDMRSNNVYYTSSNKNDFKMIESIGDTSFVVNGEEYDAKDINLSRHFIQQASERFRAPVESIKDLFLDIVANGRYICVTHSKEEYKPAHLFCKDGRLVYISLDFSTAITSYASLNKNQTYAEEVKETVTTTLFKKIKLLEKQEKTMNKKLIEDKLKLNLRIAEIELEIYKTKSEKKQELLNEELSTIKKQISGYEEEWEELIDNVRQHSIVLASFI